MSQIIPGISIGPGRGNTVYILHGNYDPNTATGFAGNIPLANVALGSLFLRYDTGGLYLKTAQPNTWTAK